MSVYVDDMRAKFGRMVLCHMVADTSAELHEMARKIGVARRHAQKEGTHKEHYDICLEKRARAVRCGAKEITWEQTGQLIAARRSLTPAEPCGVSNV